MRLRRRVSQADADLAAALEASTREAVHEDEEFAAALEASARESGGTGEDGQGVGARSGAAVGARGNAPASPNRSSRVAPSEPSGTPERKALVRFSAAAMPLERRSTASCHSGSAADEETRQLESAIALSLRLEEERAASEAHAEQATLRGFIESLADATVSARSEGAAAVDARDACGRAGGGSSSQSVEARIEAGTSCCSPAAARNAGRLLALHVLEEHVASGQPLL